MLRLRRPLFLCLALCLLLSAFGVHQARQAPPQTQWMLYRTSEGREWALYRSRMDGQGPRRLSPDDNLNDFLGWSPDGAWMYVQRYDQNQWEIYRQRPHGGQPQNISRHPNHDWFEALAPEGDWLYFQSNRHGGGNVELYRMRPDGQDVQRLTYNRGVDEFITWGPGGEWLLFESEQDRQRDLYRLNPADGSQIRLTNTPSRDIFQTWSPDGEWLIFSASMGNSLKLHRVRVDGSAQEQLTFGFGRDTFQAWSPDGEWLVLSIVFGPRGELYRFNFGSQAGAPLRNASLDPTDERLREVADVPESFGQITQANLQRLTDTHGVDTFVDWVADEGMLFQALQYGRPALMRAELPTAPGVPDASVIAQLPGEVAFKAWSPDGEWLILRSLSGRDGDIYRVRPAGGEPQALTTDSAYNYYETWTPDGEWMIFWSNRDARADLYRMRPDGQDVQRLTDTPGDDAFVGWTPLVNLPWNPAWLLPVILLAMALAGKIPPRRTHPKQR